MSINLTDELLAKTKKGKIASAKQVFLEGDQENLQQIGDKTHQLEDAFKDITVSGGASTANAVSYNNETSGMTAITAQGAFDELAAKNQEQDATIGTKAEKSEVATELDKKFNKENIAQESGDAEDKVMSQKAVSKKLSDLSKSTNSHVYTNSKVLNKYIKEIYFDENIDITRVKYIGLSKGEDFRAVTLLDDQKVRIQNFQIPTENAVKKEVVKWNNNTYTGYMYLILDWELTKADEYEEFECELYNVKNLDYSPAIKQYIESKSINNELKNKFDKSRVANLLGDSYDNVLSQRAVSDIVSNDFQIDKVSLINPINFKLTKENAILTQFGSSSDTVEGWNIFSYENNLTNSNRLAVAHIKVSRLYEANFNYFAVAILGIESNNIIFSLRKIIGEKDYYFIIPNKHKLLISVFGNDNVLEASTEYTTSPVYKIQTWGDSITDAGKYQKGIASYLNIDNSNIKNFGISSDFSMHVANRFVSYFTEKDISKVFIGNGLKRPSDGIIPTFEERQKELKDSFFVFWIGTNNLGNYRGRVEDWTVNNSSFTSLCPNFNEKLDILYSKSYLSMMFDDIKKMVNLIPHNNFLIIMGHGAFNNTEAQEDNSKLNKLILSAYPENYLDIETQLIIHSNVFYTLQSPFTMPNVNETTTLTLDRIDNLAKGENICIGTRDYFDIYQITNIDAGTLTVTAKLLKSSMGFNANDTIPASYTLVSDLGRDSVNIQTKVYLEKDINRYKQNENPWSIGNDVHFTDEGYELVGNIIGTKIKSMIR